MRPDTAPVLKALRGLVVIRHIGRLIGVLALAVLCLQLWFAGRIALMNVLAPQSTSFQRSEAIRLLGEKQQVAWAQAWVDDEQLPRTLKRAVIASEDDGFAEHGGVDWDALKGAWQKNEKAQARARRARPRGHPRSSAVRRSRSSWPRTSSCPASARCSARARSWS